MSKQFLPQELEQLPECWATCSGAEDARETGRFVPSLPTHVREEWVQARPHSISRYPCQRCARTSSSDGPGDGPSDGPAPRFLKERAARTDFSFPDLPLTLVLARRKFRAFPGAKRHCFPPDSSPPCGGLGAFFHGRIQVCLRLLPTNPWRRKQHANRY